MVKDQPYYALFLPIMLCCSALNIHLLCYAQGQELWSGYYAIYMYKFAETINYM